MNNVTKYIVIVASALATGATTFATMGLAPAIAVGCGSLVSGFTGLHMDAPKYSSKAQKPGTDSEDPR